MKTGWVEIDTISSVMNAAGDKMVTNGKEDHGTRSRKGGKAGPTATVKFGSASVPIYLSESKGRKRYFITHYRDGKRIRKASQFSSSKGQTIDQSRSLRIPIKGHAIYRNAWRSNPTKNPT